MLFGNSILQKEASFFHAQKRVKGRLHKILYTIIIVTNTNDYADILDLNQVEVLASEDFLVVIK